MPSAVINTTSNTATLVNAPAAPLYIRVKGYMLIAGGTTNVSLSSAGTALTGNLPLAAQAGAVAPYTPDGWFDLSQAQALNIAQDGGQQLGGHVSYDIKE